MQSVLYTSDAEQGAFYGGYRKVIICDHSTASIHLGRCPPDAVASYTEIQCFYIIAMTNEELKLRELELKEREIAAMEALAKANRSLALSMRKCLTEEDAAEYIGVSLYILQALRRDGKISFGSNDGSKFHGYAVSDLDYWLAGKPPESPEPARPARRKMEYGKMKWQ